MDEPHQPTGGQPRRERPVEHLDPKPGPARAVAPVLRSRVRLVQHGAVWVGVQVVGEGPVGSVAGVVGSCWRSRGSARWMARSRPWLRTRSMVSCQKARAWSADVAVALKPIVMAGVMKGEPGSAGRLNRVPSSRAGRKLNIRLGSL